MSIGKCSNGVHITEPLASSNHLWKGLYAFKTLTLFMSDNYNSVVCLMKISCLVCPWKKQGYFYFLLHHCIFCNLWAPRYILFLSFLCLCQFWEYCVLYWPSHLQGLMRSGWSSGRSNLHGQVDGSWFNGSWSLLKGLGLFRLENRLSHYFAILFILKGVFNNVVYKIKTSL